MRFLRAEIYGFGKWVDQPFDFSEGLLTCLFGENEAGKSTLQNFLMFMLFGLPPRKRSFYKPKNSNRVGGTLTVDDSKAGIYTIERIENQVTCLLPDGKEQDEKWLMSQLKGMTNEVYMSIYAFSSKDLVGIRNMKAEQLSNVLFSVGLSGATAISEVEKTLDNQIGALFKKTGRIPEINRQLKRIDEEYAKLRQVKDKEATYREEKKEKKETIAQIKETKYKLNQIENELHTLEKMHHMLPLVNDFHDTKEYVQAFPKETAFPENGVERFQSIKHQLIPLESELKVVRENQAKYKEELEILIKKQIPTTVYQSAQSIMDQYHQFENVKQQIKENETALHQINNELKEMLHEMELKESDVEETTLPFHLESSWKEISETNEQLQQEGEKLAEDYQLILQQLNRLQEEEAETKREILPEEKLDDLEMKIKEYELAKTAHQHAAYQRKNWQEWSGIQAKRANWTKIGTGVLTILSVLLAVFSD